jgi:DMSO/TMAO reductase YedYZ molybdopterin-dependent catalytic subunit
LSLAVDQLGVIPRPLFLIPVLAFVLAGCGADADAERLSLVSLTASPVADAGADAILQVEGAVERPLRLGDDTLNTLAREQVTLYEPFEKRSMTFQAVPLRDVLALAGVERGATALHTVALNDYVVDIPLDVAASDGVYLAVRNGDGSAIPVAAGGPVRIVFASGAKGAKVQNYWSWSLARVTVK